MQHLLRQVAAHAQSMVRCGRQELSRRHFSRAVASSVPPNLATQVDEFNREMQALFGLDFDGNRAQDPDFSLSHPQPSASGTASALLSSTESSSGATPAPPTRASFQEFNRIQVSIDVAFTSGELSERERRYLRLMLRNSDQQLLRLAATHTCLASVSPAAAAICPPSLPAHALLQVLDDRISHSLLQLYRQ